MKEYSIKIICLSLLLFFAGACSNDFPIDEDGLLITDREECYVSNFDLLHTDGQTIRVGNAYVDTLAQVAIAYVRFGAPLTTLWPRISLCEDAKLTPKIPSYNGWTDFSGSKMAIDFVEGDWSSGSATNQLSERIVANPSSFPSSAKRYTVISGNRKIKKEYTFLIVERPLQ
jgi:hypothetical protein